VVIVAVLHWRTAMTSGELAALAVFYDGRAQLQGVEPGPVSPAPEQRRRPVTAGTEV
jgi:hypothetical protein